MSLIFTHSFAHVSLFFCRISLFSFSFNLQPQTHKINWFHTVPLCPCTHTQFPENFLCHFLLLLNEYNLSISTLTFRAWLRFCFAPEDYHYLLCSDWKYSFSLPFHARLKYHILKNCVSYVFYVPKVGMFHTIVFMRSWHQNSDMKRCRQKGKQHWGGV